MPFSDIITPRFSKEGVQKEGKHVPWGCLAFVLCVMAGSRLAGGGGGHVRTTTQADLCLPSHPPAHAATVVQRAGCGDQCQPYLLLVEGSWSVCGGASQAR